MIGERLRVLFVCSRNRWRSPTAESLFRRDRRVEVRSAGTAASARRRVSDADLAWADLVLVMEHKHKTVLRARFGPSVGSKVEVLGIPDEFAFMDPELVALLEAAVGDLLDAQLGVE